MTESLATRLARNGATALGSQVALTALSLGTTAIVVRALGIEAFGAWTLVTALLSYGALLDLGLGGALVQRAARAHADEDRDALAAAVGATLGVLLGLSVVALVAVALLAAPAAAVLRIPPALVDSFVAAVRLAGVGVALALPSAALAAVPTAAQRLDSVVRLDAVVLAVSLVVQAGAALAGGGLVALTAITVAGRVASLAGRVVLANRMLGAVPLRFDPRYPFWRELGRFSAYKVLHHAASQLVLHLDRFLIAALVSVRAAAVYAVALELAQRLTMVSGNIAAAYFPAASAASGGADRRVLVDLYTRTSRIVALLTYPLGVGLICLAGPLLRVWVGPDLATAAAGVLRLLALGYLAMALTAIPAATADALGRPDLPARWGAWSAALNLAITATLLPLVGVLGCGIAVLAANALLMPRFVGAITRDLVALPLSPYVRRTLLGPAAPALVLGVPLLAAVLAGLAASPAGLVLTLLGGGIAFLGALRLFGVLEGAERRFLVGLSRPRSMRRLAGRGSSA